MGPSNLGRYLGFLVIGCSCLAVGFLFGTKSASISLMPPIPSLAKQAPAIDSQLASAYSPSVTKVVQKDDLFDKVKVYCWVLTFPANHAQKAMAVKETWAPRCNKVVFMSSQVDKSIPTIDLKMSGEGRDKLWEKSRKAWYYTYEHFINDYDWFLKADDDSFVIVENLRYFCSLHDPEGDFYFGRVFKPFGGYQSGGAGYVVSRGALKKVGPLLSEDEKCGKGIWQVEDAKFGACLKEVGVVVGNSQDKGKDRFHPFVPEQHLIKGLIPEKFWYRDYVMYPAQEGPECCSDLSISFHYISPNLMRQLYYFVYRLHPFGSSKRDDQMPAPKFVRKDQQLKTSDDKKSDDTGAAPAADAGSDISAKEKSKSDGKNDTASKAEKEAPAAAAADKANKLSS